jgi:hypothetical protein
MVQRGQTFLFPASGFESGSNERVEITDVERDVDETRLQLDDSLPGIGRDTTADQLRSRIDPREVQQNRSAPARNADRGQDAPLTTDPLEWASDPAGNDFPGVDTGPTFRDEQGDDFDTDSFVEDTVGINDVEDNLSDLGVDI